MSRILVVDDDPVLQRTLRINLRARGHEVLLAGSGRQAVSTFLADAPELVVLDLGLPDLDGVEVLRQVRAVSSVPVIVLSARQQADDKVEALDEGADDYVSKPFSMDELMARVRVALRHGARINRTIDPVIESGGLVIDLARRQVTRDGAEVRLTATEFKLLAYLAGHADRVLTHHVILEAVWGMEYTDQVEYLRVYLRQLRAKLEADPHRPVMLLTEPGVGYRFALL